VTLAGNQPAQIDVPLEVGSVSEVVEVTAAASTVQLNQSLTQVAVLDFVNGSQPNQSGAQVADQLSNQLLNGGQVRVIDRDKVQQAIQSQAASGRPPSAQEAAAMGRSIGADAVVVGSIEPPDGAAKRKELPNVWVRAEVIDTKQARPVATAAARGASLQLATASLGNQIQSKLAKPVEGQVTGRSGDMVSVKFAEPHGLQTGARCDVLRGTQKIGELVITSLNGQSAIGKFSGTGQPRAGDRVTALVIINSR
jgi:hypothetical protein